MASISSPSSIWSDSALPSGLSMLPSNKNRMLRGSWLTRVQKASMSCELRLLIENIARLSSKHHLLHQSLPFDPEVHDGTILHAMIYIYAYPNMKEQNLLLDLQVDELRIAFFLSSLRLGFDHWLCNPRGFASHQRFNFWDIANLSDCKKIAIQCSTDAAADAADACAATALWYGRDLCHVWHTTQFFQWNKSLL